METAFHMDYEQRGDNLLINAQGIFDEHSASELHGLMMRHYNGGRIMIDTASLEETIPTGCHEFRRRMNGCGIPPEQLLFKGEKGFAIAPDGSRVVVRQARTHTCNCVVKCANCTCKSGGHHHASH